MQRTAGALRGGGRPIEGVGDLLQGLRHLQAREVRRFVPFLFPNGAPYPCPPPGRLKSRFFAGHPSTGLGPGALPAGRFAVILRAGEDLGVFNCGHSRELKEGSEVASAAHEMFAKAQKERLDNLDQANQEIDRLRKTVEKLHSDLEGTWVFFRPCPPSPLPSPLSSKDLAACWYRFLINGILEERKYYV